jgi:hypothetical protein
MHDRWMLSRSDIDSRRVAQGAASIRDDMGEYRVVMAKEVLTELNDGYRMKISCSRSLKRRVL